MPTKCPSRRLRIRRPEAVANGTEGNTTAKWSRAPQRAWQPSKKPFGQVDNPNTAMLTPYVSQVASSKSLVICPHQSVNNHQPQLTTENRSLKTIHPKHDAPTISVGAAHGRRFLIHTSLFIILPCLNRRLPLHPSHAHRSHIHWHCRRCESVHRPWPYAACARARGGAAGESVLRSTGPRRGAGVLATGAARGSHAAGRTTMICCIRAKGRSSSSSC